ncbi:MAG: tRNA (adenosine(37)-N6)-dimethylallyltransferase MiaA [Bacteroidota bacterium]|jgi:tRNA dimethylallyltransferase
MTGYPTHVKKLIVVQGPTASGKTGLSIELARRLSTVILSADSRQFYKQMSIGTAKPSVEEQAGINHYFIDSHDITDEVTAARFAQEAEKLLVELFETKDTVILTGGSGMFVDALCEGLDDIPTDAKIKEDLTRQWKEHGLDSLLQELEQRDPEMYDTIDRNNPSRVIRALEANRVTGKPFSELRTGKKKEKSFNVIRFIIELPREELYKRIDERVDNMIALGLVDEVRSLLPHRALGVMKTVGYSELFRYLDDELILVDAISLIKQHTRNYAKRQMTWLRRYNDATLIPFSNMTTMVNVILSKL